MLGGALWFSNLLRRQLNSNFLNNFNSHFIVHPSLSHLRLCPGSGRKETFKRQHLRVDAERCSLLLSSTYRRFRPAFPRQSSFPACYRCVLAVRCAGRRGGSETSGSCIRSRLHRGQPQLNDKARRPRQGHGGDCRHLHALRRRPVQVVFAGTGFSRVPGQRHHFARQCPWSLGGRGEMATSLLACGHPSPFSVRPTSVVAACLHSFGQWSCRPQPLGSRREAAPCEDPRQDQWPCFLVYSVCFRRKVLFERLAPEGQSPRYREHAHGVLCKLCRQVHSEHETQRGLGARQQSVATVSLGRAHGPQVPDGQPSQKMSSSNPTTGRLRVLLPGRSRLALAGPSWCRRSLWFWWYVGMSLAVLARSAGGFSHSDLSSALASPFSVRSSGAYSSSAFFPFSSARQWLTRGLCR